MERRYKITADLSLALFKRTVQHRRYERSHRGINGGGATYDVVGLTHLFVVHIIIVKSRSSKEQETGKSGEP